jgi:hypothetical protein
VLWKSNDHERVDRKEVVARDGCSLAQATKVILVVIACVCVSESVCPCACQGLQESNLRLRVRRLQLTNAPTENTTFIVKTLQRNPTTLPKPNHEHNLTIYTLSLISIHIITKGLTVWPVPSPPW